MKPDKCHSECKPINAFYHGKQLVEATDDSGLYARGQMHLPCGLPGCKASILCEHLRLEREIAELRLKVKQGRRYEK